MKIEVDYDRCDSNGLCMQACPEVFEVRDDGFLYLFTEEPAEELRDKVLEAQDACPTQAISVKG